LDRINGKLLPDPKAETLFRVVLILPTGPEYLSVNHGEDRRSHRTSKVDPVVVLDLLSTVSVVDEPVPEGAGNRELMGDGPEEFH
jgi:hypothetical protein